LKPDSQNSDTYRLKKWEKYDEEYPHIKCLRNSIYGHYETCVYSNCYMKLKISKKEKKIVLQVKDLNKKIIDSTVYWTFNSLKEVSSKKFQYMIFVKS